MYQQLVNQKYIILQLIQLMYNQYFQDCFSEISSLESKNAKKVQQIIMKYCQIVPKQFPQLPEIQFHRSDLIEDKYIPSPELLNSYNSNFAKTLNIQPKVQNNLLKQSYGDMKVSKNPFDFSKIRAQSSNPLQKPSILVQHRQQTILNQLQTKKSFQATIPQMESSLRMYQLESLQRKQIKLQNNKQSKANNAQKSSLNDWKLMRQQLMKNLTKK